MKRLFPFILSLFLLNMANTNVSGQEGTLTVLGSYNSGIFDGGASEISAYDPISQQLYTVNGGTGSIDIIDISDPTAPTFVSSISLAAYGAGANSVAVKDEVVAVAVEANNKQSDGSVVFFETDGTFINEVTAGALPDMIIFTEDGMTVLVANEGEPDDDYQVDPEGSITIIDISAGVANATASTATFTSFNGTTLDASIRIYGNDNQATVAQDMEPEYIAVSADGSTAWVACQENNAWAIVDIASATVTDIVGMGLKDHSLAGNGLDASNDDDSIQIKPWPVFGFYMPDAIASYEVGGSTYIISANEGDSRDYDGYSEEERVKDLTLDPSIFTDPSLQDDENLGRLKTTTAHPDTNANGEYQTIYSYGARSFSIWDEDGNLVFDSGDDFEQTTATEIPEYFNSTNDDNDSFDNRSDDKGPEPEAVAIFEDVNKTFVYIGLERVGGIMVYEVTDPNNPVFVEYIINRDFTVEADSSAAGDLGPEGLLVISKADSPTGEVLLISSNEVSGNISIFEIESEPSTSIDETVNSEIPLVVYPNPVRDVLRTNKYVNGKVIDLLGNTVMTVQNARQIEVSALNPGIYLLHAVDGSVNKFSKL